MLHNRYANASTSAGFTLLEMMIVSAIMGILLAVATPTWMGFLQTQKLNTAREEAFSAIRSAQIQAIQKRTKWQVSFREIQGRVQWATHPASLNPNLVSVWQDLPKDVRLDSETTLRFAQGVRRVQFNYLGNVNGQLGRITFSTQNSGKTKRCVIVSTLLGAVRTGENRARKDNGKTCW